MKLFFKTTDESHAVTEARAWGYIVKAVYPRQGGFVVYATKPRKTFQSNKPEYFDPADRPSVASARHYRRKKAKGTF